MSLLALLLLAALGPPMPAARRHVPEPEPDPEPPGPEPLHITLDVPYRGAPITPEVGCVTGPKPLTPREIAAQAKRERRAARNLRGGAR